MLCGFAADTLQASVLQCCDACYRELPSRLMPVHTTHRSRSTCWASTATAPPATTARMRAMTATSRSELQHRRWQSGLACQGCAHISQHSATILSTTQPIPNCCSLEEDEERERGITPMYVKYDARLYGPRKPGQKVRGVVSWAWPGCTTCGAAFPLPAARCKGVRCLLTCAITLPPCCRSLCRCPSSRSSSRLPSSALRRRSCRPRPRMPLQVGAAARRAQGLAAAQGGQLVGRRCCCRRSPPSPSPSHPTTTLLPSQQQLACSPLTQFAPLPLACIFRCPAPSAALQSTTPTCATARRSRRCR